MGIWSESTVSEDRRTEQMTSEIQWVSAGLQYLSSLLPLVWLLLHLSSYQHYSCAVRGLIFLSICGIFAKKRNSVHTLEFGITNFREGHQTLGHTK